MAKRDERVFYVAMTDEERELTRANMKKLKDKHDVTMSAVLRKVMIEYMNDDKFLKFIGVIP